MSSQEQKHRYTHTQRDEAAEVSREHVEAKERTPEQQDLLDTSDDLLDAIDEALEGLDTLDATSFRQRGGE